MATSCSNSLTASLAPTDFKLSTSYEDHSGPIYVAVERCQLCGGSRRSFHCIKCVFNGDFVFSKTPSSERFAEKDQRWKALKEEKVKLQRRCENSVKRKQIIEEKKYRIALAKERIQIYKRGLEHLNELLDKDKRCLRDTQEKRKLLEGKYARNSDKKRKIHRFIQDIKTKTEKHSENRKRFEDDLIKLRAEHIQDLIHYIFPIKEIQTKSESDHGHEGDSAVISTVSALAEARRTCLIHGRWIYADNGSDHQYQVIDPCLPGNGDYTAYNLWVAKNKETSVRDPETELGQTNPAYSIAAALSYCTQLARILAYFLDVNLPKRLCYSEFNGSEMTEKQFTRAVKRLNHNILLLCFTQNVNPELLHPRHTVHNLIVLLNQTPTLGRNGTFEVHPDLMQSIEDPTASEHSDSSSSEDETDGYEYDWESVPTSLPEMDVPSYYASSQLQSQAGGVTSTMTTQSTAGGLMTSAAASVMSFWMAATGQGHNS